MGKSSKRIASACMEIGLDYRIPIYSGGLGILFGDMAKAAADLKLPIDFFSMLYRKGNYKQRLEQDGWQQEDEVKWYPEAFMNKLDKNLKIRIYNGNLSKDVEAKVDIWHIDVRSNNGGSVPIYLFSLYNKENPDFLKFDTDYIYTDDGRKRLHQEIVLGMGTVKFGDEFGIEYDKYHMNEGHSAFLILELMKKGMKLEDIIKKCVFTTHTPVESGLQKFEYSDVKEVLKELIPENITELAGHDRLNMATLALNCSNYINAVSKKHAEISSIMFRKKIDYITNGVDSETWASSSFQKLYDQYCGGWRTDGELLKNAKNISIDEIVAAHNNEKNKMIDSICNILGIDLDPKLLTIGFARRIVDYKRADLIFDNLNELRRIGKGKLQLIFAGKTHPNDKTSKETLKRIFYCMKELGNDIKCAFIPDYNIHIAELMTAGCDIWLNNPLPPNEASGTSGMCAAVNGVPQLGTLDGWWCEGWKEDVTGWSIGKEHDIHEIHSDSPEAHLIRNEDSKSMLEKLENKLILSYEDKLEFAEIQRNTIAINASYFNAHRMMKEYAERALKIKI